MSLTLFSPAKINLFLRILKRRVDGFHEIATLLQTVGLYDKLTFELDSIDSLTCSDQTIPTDASNLVLKAAHLFRKKTGKSFGIKVHLDKQIPAQAGLGGGSGNAATTLWALNQLSGVGASAEELKVWAGEIGSDISFFFSQGTAYCTGRGERIQEQEPLFNTALTLIKPSEGLSTPQVYKTLNLDSLCRIDPQEILRSFWSKNPCYVNDLELPAFSLMPKLEKMRNQLLDTGFKTVMMSGSGSSLFCLGEGEVRDFEDVSIYKVPFCTRKKDLWYEE